MSRREPSEVQPQGVGPKRAAAKRVGPKRSRRVLVAALALLGVGSLLVVGLVVGVVGSNREQVDRAAAAALAEGIGRITRGVVDAVGEIQPDEIRASRGVRQYDPSLGVWVERSDVASGHAVLLIHGLDEPGGIWDQLAPALATDGHTVLRFDYSNDQAIVRSADELGFALRGLAARGFDSLDLVCHSMGGLVARDALSREGSATQRPAVETLITLGTPHGGSPWARLRTVAEAREQVQRWAQSDDLDPARLLGFMGDGGGQAGIDLLPGSAYLTRLDARTLPEHIRVICVVGRVDEPNSAVGTLGSAVARGTIKDLLGEREASVVLNEVDRLGRELGDGVVPVSSAVMAGADEVIMVRANHRAMIRTIELEEAMRRQQGLPEAPQPPAIEIVLHWLHRD